MRGAPSTADDFARWGERAKAMTEAQLQWSLDDCREAAVACDKTDPIRAGRLMDEAYVYRQELSTR